MLRLALAAAFVALLIGTPITAASAASRHGSVSIVVTPHGRDAEVIREGYDIYSMLRHRKNRATIDQKGTGNGAAIAQHGDNNAAEIFQRGDNHSATVTQTGRNNLFGVFQFGRGTRETATQTGTGQTGFAIRGGW